MAEPKTQKTKASVNEFLDAIEDPQQRKDAKAVAKMMAAATGACAAMWGGAIVGCGSYRYEYASGRTGEWPRIGFSPRKGNSTLYLMGGFPRHAALMKSLGKHKTGKSCLYINKLADIDADVLQRLVDESLAQMNTPYPA